MSNSTNSIALGRIAKLLDAGSFVEIGAQVNARYDTGLGGANGDGVVTGYGTIDGALVYVYAQDPKFLGGSVGEMHAKKISKIYKMAVEMGAPVIALVDCAGVRLNEGGDSLFSFGRIFKHQADASGIIPQIEIILGSCGGGMAVSASMADFVFMEKDNGKLFVTSPNAVIGNYEGKCDTAGADYQTKETGLCDFSGSEDEIYAQVRELVSILPQNNVEDFSETECTDDLNRSVAGIEKLGCKCEMLTQIADDGKFVAVKKGHTGCICTGFLKINGRTIGAVANNAKEICHMGCKKAISFINFCDAFNIPVLTLVDVEGIKRDEANEKFAAKALGKLAFTYSHITVPTVTLITGKAYGTAGVIMNSKALGADLVYAWTGAEMGLMNKDLLAKIEDLPAGDTSSTAYNAGRGFIDDIIAPEETRQRVAAAFEMLYTKTATDYMRKHGTV